ncbi:MAG TPA: hypothetical protein VFI48_17230 [Hyphomicrobiaceae bacterium]|jgi:hypothetical protein|nr:hypothetical protein [Hyphomicrobiaceae bacterium]
MSKKPASVFERVSKLLYARDRVHKLQRHVDLTYQFALVAPLGGGAMLALQALHLPESDEDLLHLPGALGALRGWAVSP